MLNRLATATAALAVLGASSVCAQPAPPDRPEGTRPPAVSREDAGAYLEARIAALHSGLQLTPDQERLWPPFEQAVRELAKLRQQGAQVGAQEGARQRGGEPSTADDLMARIERRADALTRRGAALKALAQAAAPLWQSLDDSQKRRFAVLARPSNFRGGFGARDERGGFGRGFGPGGPRPGRDGDFGRRRFGFGGPGRDGDRYGFGGPRGFGPRGFGRDGDGYRYGFDPRDFGPRDLGPREFGRREFGRDGDGYRYGDGRRDFDRREFWRRDFDRRDFGQRDLGRRDSGRDGDFYRYGYGPAPREFEPRGFEPRDFGSDGGGYRYDYGPRDYRRGRGLPGGGFRTLDESEGELGTDEANGADERL
jgi:LTXXQ motif family protein